MKRVSWVVLLCALFALCASPGWAVDFPTASSGTITLLAGETYTLSQGKKYESKVEIVGNGATITCTTGAPAITFSGNAGGSTISNVTFKGCTLSVTEDNKGGAAIYIDSAAVTIDRCKFENNYVTSNSNVEYAGGGAIYTNNTTGTVIKDCTFTNNAYFGNGGGTTEAGGGAIYNYTSVSTTPKVTITGCTFTGNGETATNISAVGNTYGKHYNTSGGAMTNITGANSATLEVEIDDCTFDSNETSRYGGAVYNITNANTGTITATITNSTFTGNKLANYENNGSFGGAIANYGAKGKIDITIEDTLFKSNTTSNTGWSSNPFGATGGAIASVTNFDHETGNVTTTISNCRFEGNEANQGGAIANWGNSGTANVAKLENCTFINNKAIANSTFGPTLTTVTNGTTLQGYPRGSAVWTKGNADGQHTDQGGTASTNLYNCTFYNNESVSGGAIAVIKVAGTDVVNEAEATLYNCTFVNNTLKGTDPTSAAGGVEAYNDGGTLSFTNTVFYNPGKTLVTNANSSGTVTLKNSAYNGTLGITVPADTATKANAVFTNADSKTTATAMISGVEHTVFKLTESDTALTTGGTTGTDVPTTDQLGYKRSTTAPSIGAVEYVTLAVSTAKALPAGTVGTAYKAELEAAFTPAQASADLVWDLKSGSSLPDGLSLDISGVISGTPTTANTYTFTLTVAGSGDLYSSITKDQAFTLVINERAAVSLDVGTVTITSTGGTSNLAISLASTDYSDLAKTSSSDLTNVKTGTLTVNSGDQSGVVVTIAPGDAEIAAVSVGSTSVTVSSNKFTPSAAGTYKIIFKGTDDNDIEKYFAAAFTYSIVTPQPTIDSGDIEGEEGSYTIKEGTQIISRFVSLIGEELLNYVSSFFSSARSITSSNRASPSEMSEILNIMGLDASDVGDEENGYNIVGVTLDNPIPAMTKFLVILRGSDNTIYTGIGVTQTESNVFVINFKLLKKAAATVTSEMLKFKKGKYTVGVTDSSEYFTTSETSEAGGVLKTGGEMSLTDDATGSIGSLSFGEMSLAGTEETTSSRDSSSSGCDTGAFGISTLLALAGFALVKKGRK